MKSLKLLFGMLISSSIVGSTTFGQSFLTNGLVAYYPFDGNATDTTGNGNGGSIAGAVGITNRFGMPNSALYFNGTNSTVAISNQFLNIGADYTLSLWFCTFDSSFPFQELVNSRPNPAIDLEYNAALHGGDLYLDFSIGTGTDWLQPTQQHGPKNDFRSHQWYHIVAVKNGSAYTTFINGVQDASFSRSPGSLLVGLQVGSTMPDAGGQFSSVVNGIIDDFRVYNRALSATEIQDLYALESQPPAGGTIHFTTANPNEWLVSGGGATNATPFSFEGITNSITIISGSDSGTYVNGMTHFNGFWTADYAFYLPSNATNITLTYSNFYVDDRGMLLLNGNPIIATGIPFFGNLNPGSLVLTDGGSPQPYSDFVGPVGSVSGTVTNGFIVGGFNTMRVIVNNTHAGVYGPDIPVSSGDGTSLALTGVVNYESRTSPTCIPHRATATAQVVNGFVIGLTLTDGGCGYTNSPVVLITGGGGTGATATAVVNGGVVTALNITDAGVGYTNTPTVKIASPPFMPWLDVTVSKVTVTQHVVLGKNYVLESSTDMHSWTQVGPQFTAQDELITQEFDVDAVGRFFRIRQVP